MKEDLSFYDENSSQLALLAQDSSYSLSPFIHEKSAELLSRDVSYQSLCVSPSENLSALLEKLKKDGISGFNVTNPFKRKITNYVDSSGLLSVNTVSLRKDGTWKAYSTDGEGFYGSMNRNGFDIESFEALCFFGSGDVIFSLLDFLKNLVQGQSVYFIRRSSSRDKEFKKYFSRSIFLPFEPSSLEVVLNQHNSTDNICLIQATSAPMKGSSLEEFIPKLSAFKGVFCDLLYSRPSAMYKYLKERKERVIDGLPMLMEQALLSQKIWWGESVSYDLLKKELESYLKQKEIV